MVDIIGPAKQRRVLLIDDEISVINALTREIHMNFGEHVKIDSYTDATVALKNLSHVHSQNHIDHDGNSRLNKNKIETHIDHDVNCFHHNHIVYDLLIVDQMMPNMDGASFLEQFVRLNPYTPAIMLSARARTEDLARALNSGSVWKFYFKPWNGEELAATILEGFLLHDKNLELQGIDEWASATLLERERARRKVSNEIFLNPEFPFMDPDESMPDDESGL